MFRSILSVVLGFILMSILTIVNFVILFSVFSDLVPAENNTTPIELPLNALVFVFTLDILVALFGGYFTAAIAIVEPLKHARALAILIFVMRGVTLATTFGDEPLPYAISRFIGAPLAVYFGGWFRARQKAEAPDA
jgi:hypothetical protein